MKKNLQILLIILILSSCQNEKVLNGTWISAYEYNENDSLKEPITGIPFNQLISFENGFLEIEGFKYNGYEKLRKDKFKLKGNKLIIGDNKPYYSDVFEQLTKDSITLSGVSYGGKKRVYKKLNDSLKNKSTEFKLTGKKFFRSYKNWTDTIQFINESVFTSSSWSMGNSDLNWQRINHNGFDILFTDIYPPFLIKKKSGSEIYISTFDKKKENYILEEIK